MEQIQRNDTILAHWIYNWEDWKRVKKYFSSANLLVNFLRFFKSKPANEIKITKYWVSVNNQLRFLLVSENSLPVVKIYEEGLVNILEIKMIQKKGDRVMKLPIPRGKLREALAVQEQLTGSVT